MNLWYLATVEFGLQWKIKMADLFSRAIHFARDVNPLPNMNCLHSYRYLGILANEERNNFFLVKKAAFSARRIYFLFILNVRFKYIFITGRPKNETLKELREQYYSSNIERIIQDGKFAPKSSNVFQCLAKLTGKSLNAERMAARRYAIENDLVKAEGYTTQSDEELFTPFGNVKESAIIHQVDISDQNLFYNRDEKRDKLQSEFAGKLIKLTYKITKYPCCWSYGRIFKQNGEVKLHAVCLNIGCNAVKTMYTEGHQSKLNISFFQYDETIQHTKRKYVSSDDKEKMSLLLDAESAMVAHAKLANEYIFGDNKYAAHLPSAGALRQRKYKNSLNRRHELSIISAAIMKREGRYRQYIHDIGLDPFYIIFRSPLQQRFLIDQHKKGPCIISIDATGVTVTPPKFGSISKRTSKSMKPFLYIITLHGQTYNVPIHQILSQRHSHEFLGYLLVNWKHRHNDGKSPNEVIIDQSQALIIASIQAFTSSQTMEDYLSRCHDALFEDVDPPECYIRLDRNHFVATVHRNKHLKKLEKKKRNFLLRIIGYLMICDSMKDAMKTITQLFVVLQNDYIHSDQVNEARENLISLARCHKHIIDDYSTLIDCDYDETDKIESADKKSKFQVRIEKIRKNVQDDHVKTDIESDDDQFEENTYASQKSVQTMIDILAKLPMFSNIMNAKFGSLNKAASSACTEAQFRNLKSYVFSEKKSMKDIHKTINYYTVFSQKIHVGDTIFVLASTSIFMHRYSTR